MIRWPWNQSESDLDLEVRHHLETLADAFERQGMSREDAMRQARTEFGGVERVKDECRDESSWNWLINVGQDVRFGWRMMRKTPTITLAAILSLALGIGATTAILTLADGLLWRTIGAPAPRQLVELMWDAKKRPDALVQSSWGGDFQDGGMQVFDFFNRTAYETMRTRLAGRGQVAAHLGTDLVSASIEGQVSIARERGVSGNFFSMLELRPFEGRLFSGADDSRGAQPVVVVTHRFWTRQLGADRRRIGAPLENQQHPLHDRRSAAPAVRRDRASRGHRSVLHDRAKSAVPRARWWMDPPVDREAGQLVAAANGAPEAGSNEREAPERAAGGLRVELVRHAQVGGRDAARQNLRRQHRSRRTAAAIRKSRVDAARIGGARAAGRLREHRKSSPRTGRRARRKSHCARRWGAARLGWCVNSLRKA